MPELSPPAPRGTATDAEVAARCARPAAPPALGPYRPLRLLGEGGMGEVWLADQVEPVRRQVAVKVIKAGMDTRRVVARFEAERQALAAMSHPAIAQVFDGGTTPEGRPYFVMEYIDGASLTAHCDRHRLSTEARLELLVEVCAGVQHAHQKAIIHRDLKPSNILVALREGRAQPKIIDFGIAKAVGDQPEARERNTVLGAVVGTPEYMSPEQADPVAGGLDTRSDVYSLGVILHELLTGQLPGGAGRRPSSRDAPPLPPSSLLRVAGPATDEAARNRAAAPQPLARALEGDLDAITLKALEHDRGRRYGTPSALAEDLQRYLRREPVLAQPPSAAYRARKYVQRHRTLVASAASLLVALVGGVVVSAWQAQRAMAAERRASAEAAAAQAISDFLENDLLGQADVARQSGGEGPDPEVKVRTLLDRAAARLEGRFAGQPALECSLRTTIGNAYLGLGLWPPARQQLERAAALGAAALGPGAALTLEAETGLAQVDELQGRYAEAQARSLQVLERRRRLLGPEHPDTLQSLVALTHARYLQGQYAEAEAGFAEALELQRRVQGPEDPRTLRTMMQLANTYSVRSKQQEAAALYRQTLELQRRVLGPEHPDVLLTTNNLGMVLLYQGQTAAAAAELAALVPVEQRVLGPEHHRTLDSQTILAEAYLEQGRYQQAEAVAAGTLAVQRRVLPPGSEALAVAGMDLGQLHLRQGRLAEAEAELAAALQTAGAHGPESLLALDIQGMLGHLRAVQGRYAEAEAAWAGLLATRRRVQGEDHADALDAEVGLAVDAQLPLGRAALAGERLARALERLKGVSGPAHPRTLDALEGLALAARAQGHLVEAEARYRALLEARRQVQGAEAPQALDAAQGLALTLLLAGRPAEAAEQLEPVLEVRRRVQGARVPATLEAEADLALAHQAAGRPADGEALAREALAAEEALRPSHWRPAFARSLLGALLEAQGRRTEARPLLAGGAAGLASHLEAVPAPERFRVERARGWLGAAPPAR